MYFIYKLYYFIVHTFFVSFFIISCNKESVNENDLANKVASHYLSKTEFIGEIKSQNLDSLLVWVYSVEDCPICLDEITWSTMKISNSKIHIYNTDFDSMAVNEFNDVYLFGKSEFRNNYKFDKNIFELKTPFKILFLDGKAEVIEVANKDWRNSGILFKRLNQSD